MVNGCLPLLVICSHPSAHLNVPFVSRFEGSTEETIARFSQAWCAPVSELTTLITEVTILFPPDQTMFVFSDKERCVAIREGKWYIFHWWSLCAALYTYSIASVMSPLLCKFVLVAFLSGNLGLQNTMYPSSLKDGRIWWTQCKEWETWSTEITYSSYGGERVWLQAYVLKILVLKISVSYASSVFKKFYAREKCYEQNTDSYFTALNDINVFS